MNTLTFDSTENIAHAPDAAMNELLGYFDRHPAQALHKLPSNLYQLDACVSRNLSAQPEQSSPASYRTALLLWH